MARLSLWQKLQLKKKKYFGFFASWFTFSHFISKTLQLMIGLIIVVLVFVWDSEGVRITTFNQGDYNYRDGLFYFIGVDIFTIIYSIAMTTLGVTGINIPPKALVFFAGLGVGLWLVAGPIMSGTLDTIEYSVFGRMNELDLTYLRVVSGMGLVLLMIFVLDVLLAFMALRRQEQIKAGEIIETDIEENNANISRKITPAAEAQ
jgi:hypothetical protein